MNHGVYDFANDEDKSRFAGSVTKEAIGEAVKAMQDMGFAFGSILACLDIMASIPAVGEDARKAYNEIEARFGEVGIAFDAALDALKDFAAVAAQKMEGRQ